MPRPTWTLTGPLSAPHGAVLAGTELTLSLVTGVSRDPSGSDLRAGSTVAVVGADGTLTVKGTGDPVMLLASSPDAPVHYRLSCIPRVLPTVTFTAPEGGTLALDDIVPEVPAPIPPVDASTLRAEWQAALAALVLDHGALTGLGEDDHTQYLTEARGDARYVQGNDSRLSDARTPTAHTHPVAQVSDSTATGRALVTATDAAAARGTLGLDTAATVGALPIPDPGSYYPTDTITAALQLIGGRERYGTGMPNGVVTAPVGTYYIDTAGTNGAWRWIKKAGTGNTGWVCIEGDTGLRRMDPADFLAPFNVTGSQGYIRRINDVVYYSVLLYTDSPLTAGSYPWPGAAYLWGLGANMFSVAGAGPLWNSNNGAHLGIASSSSVVVPATVSARTPMRSQGFAIWAAPWPTTLPGVAS